MPHIIVPHAGIRSESFKLQILGTYTFTLKLVLTVMVECQIAL